MRLSATLLASDVGHAARDGSGVCWLHPTESTSGEVCVGVLRSYPFVVMPTRACHVACHRVALTTGQDHKPPKHTSSRGTMMSVMGITSIGSQHWLTCSRSSTSGRPQRWYLSVVSFGGIFCWDHLARIFCWNHLATRQGCQLGHGPFFNPTSSPCTAVLWGLHSVLPAARATRCRRRESLFQHAACR